MRYVRVIRAYHPLAGQVVKVLRQTREPGREGPRWIVQAPGRPPVSLPLSWALLVDDTTDLAPGPIETADDGPCVDVTALQNLAIMVARLRANPPLEVADHDESIASDIDPPPTGRVPACLGPTAPSTPPRADRHPGSDASQATAPQSEDGERGSR